jgi:hypothetical protein
MPQLHRWLYRHPLGSVDANRAMGTVAAPLLAGFTLTTVVVLLTSSGIKTIPLYEWGIMVFAIASVLFVFAVQFTFMGLMYAASPSERVEWLPRLSGQDPDDDAYAAAAKVQEMDLVLQERYFTRAARLYGLGILAYTVGLGLIITPRDWDVPRGIAMTVLVIALVLEVIWYGSSLLERRAQWLVPGYASLAKDRREPSLARQMVVRFWRTRHSEPRDYQGGGAP